MLGLYLITNILAFKIQIKDGLSNQLILGILHSPRGPLVRLVDITKVPANSFAGLFDIQGCTSNIQALEGFICADMVESSVEICSNKSYSSTFSFKKIGAGYMKIVNEHGECLSKAGPDFKNGGFYVELSACSNTMNQRFSVDKVEKYPCLI